MKKIFLFVTILFISIFSFYVNIFSSASCELSVRDIYVENTNLDISHIEKKYDVHNTKNTMFEMHEEYDNSKNVIANNSLENEFKIKYNVYVNKAEKYFIFSYELFKNQNVILSSNVTINILIDNNIYYFISSNGYITPCDEIKNISIMEHCALSFACFEDATGLDLLIDELTGRGGGIVTLGVALTSVAGAVILDHAINDTNSTDKTSINNGVDSYNAASGGMTPNDDDNDKKSREEKVKELSDDISDEYKQNYKCTDYADQLENAMKENNIPGERIEIKSGSKYIYSDEFGTISSNSKHVGIKVNDIIFDNLHPNGINYSDWLYDIGYYDTPYMFDITKILF